VTYQTLAVYAAYIADIASTLDYIFSMYRADPTGCHASADEGGHPNNRSWLMEYVNHYAFGAAHIIVPDLDHYMAMLITAEIEQKLDTFSGDDFHVLFVQSVAKIVEVLPCA
jgi:hypothetical protein